MYVWSINKSYSRVTQPNFDHLLDSTTSIHFITMVEFIWYIMWYINVYRWFSFGLRTINNLFLLLLIILKNKYTTGKRSNINPYLMNSVKAQREKVLTR